MKVLLHKNVNLHSPSSPNGLVSVTKGIAAEIPDDVVGDPGFHFLKGEGSLIVLDDIKTFEEVDEEDADSPVEPAKVDGEDTEPAGPEDENEDEANEVKE